MIPGKKYTPEDLLQIAWRRKWYVVVPFVLISVASIIVARALPDQFRSETLILVVPQRVPESYVRSTVTTSIADRLQSISQQILSRTRLERIIQDLNLYQKLRRTDVMEDVVEQMRRDIEVQIVKGDAFRVAYVSEDPRRAMQVTERLASLFIDENLKDREVLAEGTNQFLETQLEDARRRLIENEKKIEEYRRVHSGELPNQLDSNLQAMNGMQLQMQAVVDALNRDRDRRLLLERMLADVTSDAASSARAQEDAAANTTASPVPADGSVAQAGSTQQQLEAARKLLANLELRLKPAHPDILRTKRAIVDLEAKAEAEATATPVGPSGPPPGPAATAAAEAANRVRSIREEIDSLDRQIASKDAEQTRLKNLIADYQRRVEAIPTRESEFTELSRDYTTLQASYTSLLSKNEEAKISANLERRQIGEQFKVLDPARLPEKPFSPDRMRIVLMGTFGALAAAIGLVALLEYKDTTLKSDTDVLVALALPVLALVPTMRSPIELREIRRRRVLLSMASLVTLAVVAVAAFVVWKMKFNG